jgi:glycerate dehydrogenase
LADAIDTHVIAAAGLDVLTHEPMRPDSPFLRIKDSRRLLITPHIAWASVEARTNLMDLVYEHILNFQNP